MDCSLYDEDSYLWSQQQAQALRAEGARAGGSNALDWDLLAEEVEDLGGSQLRECLSRTSTILEHLFKLASGDEREPIAGWRSTIRLQRRDLKPALTPSIHRKVIAQWEDLHLEAAGLAPASLEDHGETVRIDESRRWSFPAILGETNDPLAKGA